MGGCLREVSGCFTHEHLKQAQRRGLGGGGGGGPGSASNDFHATSSQVAGLHVSAKAQ